MSHESNPFKKLAEEFATKNSRKARAEKTPAAFAVAKKNLQDEGADTDSNLFLDAMSRIKPLSGKKNKTGGRQTLAEAFATKMKDATEAEMFFSRNPQDRELKKDKKQKMHGRSDAEKEMGTGGLERENAETIALSRDNSNREDSFAAMLDSLDRGKAGPGPEDLHLFARAMQGVVPVTSKGREVVATTANGGATARVDPSKALRDVLEGRVEFALHHTNEYMEGFVVGVDPLVLARLRNGQYSPEAHVDLHGMNARQAYDALVFFIKNAYQRGLRTVVVVTGRGRNSPDGIGILRGMLQRWLCREPFKRVVLAFCTAKQGDGGPGAAYVLLRKYKKSRGKIIWEHTPSDDDFPDV